MFICEEDIRRKYGCYSVTENFFGIMKSELLNAKIHKGIRTGSQLITRPTSGIHFIPVSVTHGIFNTFISTCQQKCRNFLDFFVDYDFN